MSPPAPLRLHHIGYAAPDIAAATHAYIHRFGYEICTPIIHDPLQTAFVQFLQMPGDPIYIEFVAPHSASSKLSVAAARGGTLNHLCYTSGPLEDAIAHLEATGLRLISDPKPAVAFAHRRICWLAGGDRVPIELVERRSPEDVCTPGLERQAPAR